MCVYLFVSVHCVQSRVPYTPLARLRRGRTRFIGCRRVPRIRGDRFVRPKKKEKSTSTLRTVSHLLLRTRQVIMALLLRATRSAHRVTITRLMNTELRHAIHMYRSLYVSTHLLHRSIYYLIPSTRVVCARVIGKRKSTKFIEPCRRLIDLTDDWSHAFANSPLR